MAEHPDNVSRFSVRLRNAHLRFAGLSLFEGLEVELAAGQWTCVLGPSGVGKTSLLRLLAGLGDGAAGQVVCGDGRPLTGRAAYMAQQDLLFPWLSVLDNVLLGSRLRREAPDRARAQRLLERVGLGDRARDRPATLSAGMRQRAALVRTLMEDRPVVLMDEPFSALDAITRLELQAVAARLLAGRTVLLVTHDPLEALRLGHAIHVMYGRPARLDRALAPTGTPPRDVTDPALLALQGDLLARLGAAKRAEARTREAAA
jgi:putative hydroxymethylpyrimidine transport system ATP-binding protein